MTTINVQVTLTEESLARLQREVEARQLPLDVVVSEALEAYYEEPTNEEILANIQQALKDALAGEVRPAHEVLDEIEQELVTNADEG